MTPEAQRIAIGKVCGLTRDSLGPDWDKLPDYLQDRGAIMRAVLTMDSDQQFQFMRHLMHSDDFYDSAITHGFLNGRSSEQFIEDHLCRLGWDEVWCRVVLASCEDIARALLRALNLWEY